VDVSFVVAFLFDRLFRAARRFAVLFWIDVTGHITQGRAEFGKAFDYLAGESVKW
jgi:hypothetical protein